MNKSISNLRINRDIKKKISNGVALTSAGFAGATITTSVLTSDGNSILGLTLTTLSLAAIAILMRTISELDNLQIKLSDIRKTLMECNKEATGISKILK